VNNMPIMVFSIVPKSAVWALAIKRNNSMILKRRNSEARAGK
jgi:hypothetical protein